MQQRKLIRYMGAVLKITTSVYYGGSDPGYMEWLAILPAPQGRMRMRLTDPTSCAYSVSGMNFWLRYGKDAVHDHFVYENRRKAHLDYVPWNWPSKGVHRLTKKDRMIFKRHVHVKNKLRVKDADGTAYKPFGDSHITKYPPSTCAIPWFQISKELYDARYEEREREREVLTGNPSEYLLYLKEQKLQREQDELDSNGKGQLATPSGGSSGEVDDQRSGASEEPPQP